MWIRSVLLSGQWKLVVINNSDKEVETHVRMGAGQRTFVLEPFATQITEV